MALEDAACLGIIFGPKYYKGNVQEALQLYEQVRKPRATKVQAAAARARENIHERIGMSLFDGDGKIPTLTRRLNRFFG